MTTTVTIELTDEEVTGLREINIRIRDAVMAKIAAALPTPLQVGDRVAFKSPRDGEIERYVTWIDPGSDRVHYRRLISSGEWFADYTSSGELVKVDGEGEAS